VAGVSLVLRRRELRLVASVRWAVAFSLGAQVVLLPLVSRDLLGTGAAGLGLLEASIGLGGMLGATCATRLVRGTPAVLLLGAAAVAVAVAMAALSLAHRPPVAYGLLSGQGAAAAVLNVLAVTLLQRHVPTGRLARVDGLVAAIGLAVGIGGSAAGAALLEVVPVRLAPGVVAVGAAAAGLTVLVGRSWQHGTTSGSPPVGGPPARHGSRCSPGKTPSSQGDLRHHRPPSGRATRGCHGDEDVPLRGPGRVDGAADPAG
jgi:MFS family permease